MWSRAETALSGRPRLRSLLASMHPVASGSGVLSVRVDPQKRTLVARHAAELAELITPAVGHRLRLEILEDAPGGDGPAPDLAPDARRGEATARDGDGVSEEVSSVAGDPTQHPLVQGVATLFGAKIVDVTRKPASDRPTPEPPPGGGG